MDYFRCSASIEIEDEASQKLTNDDTDTTNMTNGMTDYYNDEDIYDYNIVIDTKDMTVVTEDQPSRSHCDQQSCQVDLVDNTESPGFFGAITKLLQPLFSLEL